MKKSLLFLGLLSLLLLSACGGSSGQAAKIDSVTLSRDDGNGNAGTTATSFAPTDHIIHATANLENLATGWKATFTWVAVDAGGKTNKTIASVDVTALVGNSADGQISLPNDWPTGKYRVDVYLNGTLGQSFPFTIQ